MPKVSPKTEKRCLTGKQAAFVPAYADPNSTTYNNAYQSALEAGYSVATARQACVILVDNCSIKPALVKYTTNMKAESIATRAQRQAFWTEVYLDKTANMSDRLRSSELLGKSECDFITVNINDDISQPEPLSEADRAELRRLSVGLHEAG